MLANKTVGHCLLNGTSDLSSELDVYNEECVRSYVDTRYWNGLRQAPLADAAFSVLYAMLCVVAIALNTPVLVALCRRRLVKSKCGGGKQAAGMNRFECLLANVTVSHLITAVVFWLLWRASRTKHFWYGALGCKLGNMIPSINVNCSALTLASMAFERYQAVTQRQRSTSSTITYVWIGMVWVVSVFCSSPLMLMYELKQMHMFREDITLDMDANLETTNYQINFCAISSDHATLTLCTTVLQSLTVYVLPTVVIAWFNHLVAAHLRRYRDDCQVAQSQVSSAPQQRRASWLLFISAASYAILWLPFTLLTVLYDLSAHGYVQLPAEIGGVSLVTIDELAKIGTLLPICVVNPFIYGLMNTNVRTQLKALINQLRKSYPISQTGSLSLTASIGRVFVATTRRLSQSSGHAHATAVMRKFGTYETRRQMQKLGLCADD